MERSFDVAGPVTLDVRLASGDVTVDPTLEGRVEVELVAHDEEAEALIDAARVEQRDGRIVVDVPHKRSGGGFGFGFALLFGRSGISCRVRCPASSNLEVRSKSADVAAHGTLGTVSVRTASGDVVVEDVGALDVKSASGDVRANLVGGRVGIESASGDIVVDRVGGDVQINAVSGDVRIGEAFGELDVRTVSGDQVYDSVGSSNVTSNSVSGDVQVAIRRGTRVYLDCNTMSGDTRSDLDMTGEPAADGPQIELRVKTVSGDIRITRAPHSSTPPADSAQEVHA